LAQKWRKTQKKESQLIENQLGFVFLSTQSRDRTGMEVNPLVFETSASTNSAIWAYRRKVSAKVHIFSGLRKSYLYFYAF
jgi:hypothetical protein